MNKHTEIPFEIDVTVLTSEQLGKLILKKLPTSKMLIFPIENTERGKNLITACNYHEKLVDLLKGVYETRNGLPLDLAESIRNILSQLKEEHHNDRAEG